jgi:hypothetical protein
VSDELTKPSVAKPLLAKPLSMSIARETNYRVSKAQSLRMRAYDKKVEAAETKKAKAIAAQKTNLEKNGTKSSDAR